MKKLISLLFLCVGFVLCGFSQTSHYKYVCSVNNSNGVKFNYDLTKSYINANFVTFYNNRQTVAFSDANGVINASGVYFSYKGEENGLHVYHGAYSSNPYSPKYYLIAYFGLNAGGDASTDIYFSADYKRFNMRLNGINCTHVGERTTTNSDAPTTLY